MRRARAPQRSIHHPHTATTREYSCGTNQRDRPRDLYDGGPKHGTGPHASLILDLELGPGAARTISFAEAALDTIPEGFDLARKTAARPWQAELARIEMLDESQTLDIRTGDVEWDAALAFSQKAAHALFMQSDLLPHPSFVQARHSDHGHSNKGDGTDYPPAWSGQFALDAYYLASILNVAPQATKNLLLNFLSTQNEDGEVDGKPGIAGQRGHFLSMPILASMAWKYYQTARDDEFLAEVFPKLFKFFWSWFSGAHDRNREARPNGITSCKPDWKTTRYSISGTPGLRGWMSPSCIVPRSKPCYTAKRKSS